MVRDMIADLETLGGSRRERRTFNALKVLWPPKRLLDKEDPAIKKFLEAEYALGTDYEAKGNKADLKAAENAILVEPINRHPHSCTDSSLNRADYMAS